MEALEQVANQVLPKGMGYDWNALSYQQDKASKQVNAAAVFGFSLLVVFLILAAQYESWTLPFSVLQPLRSRFLARFWPSGSEALTIMSMLKSA